MHTLSLLDIFTLQTAALAGIVYILIEAFKSYTGGPLAWRAIAANLWLSFFGVAGIAVRSRHAGIEQLGQFVLVAAAAAGIQGTVDGIIYRRSRPVLLFGRGEDSQTATGASRSKGGPLSHPPGAKGGS